MSPTVSGSPVTTPPTPLRFSVVINTFNRLPYLKNTLASLRQQTHPCFEVVVVDGPSTDGTGDFLRTHRNDLVVVEIRDRNLSRSRNAGIDAAVGDVVCFIDDDAVADPLWLAALAESYADGAPDAVGGFVYDHTGYWFQSRYLYCDRLGRVAYDDVDRCRHFNFPGSRKFPYLMGTNASFRREALREVAGFDEVFAWFYDESELCLRLNDAGFRIAINPRAIVYHKYAPSHLRTAESTPKTYFLPARSTSYFVHRHGLEALGASEVCNRLADFRRELEHWATVHHASGRMDVATRDLLIDDVQRGIDAGYEESRRHPDGAAPGIGAAPNRELLQLPRLLPPDGEPLHIGFLSTEYATRPCGGIGKYLRELAMGLVQLGHHVHVIMPGERFSVDYVDGVFVHTVPWNAAPPEGGPEVDLPSVHRNVSALLDQEARRVHAHDPLDVVVGTIWDHPGMVTLLAGWVPFVLTLHSTHRIVLEQNARMLDAPFVTETAPKLIAAERLALERSPTIVANSDYFSRHVQGLYGLDLGDRIVTIHHGLDDRAPAARAPGRTGPRRKVLYVGRFEYRKGADLLLDAIPSVLAATEGGVEFDLVGEDRPREASGETFGSRFGREHGDLVERGLVRFHGVVSDADLDRFYREADVFVAPSRFESFGLIYVEAMMYGLPAVALASGAATEIFEDGVDGVLVREATAAALARALLGVLERSDGELAALGGRARRSFETKYTRARMADAFARQLVRSAGV